MALTYPGYVVPQPSQTKLTDLLDLWDQGVAQGKADRYEREAQQLTNASAPLSEFGLTMPPDQLRALFANPMTRQFATQMVRAAAARRELANGALHQPGIESPRYQLPRMPQPAAAVVPDAPGPQAALISTYRTPATTNIDDRIGVFDDHRNPVAPGDGSARTKKPIEIVVRGGNPNLVWDPNDTSW